MDKEYFAGLKKEEILRGYESFDKVFKKSKLFRTELLSGYLKTDILSTISNQSPLIINNFKVGFVVSKKKFRRANKRNRIKRLLRESFRLNRENYLTDYSDLEISLILGINFDSETADIDTREVFKFNVINGEMMKLLGSIRGYLDSRTGN
jgi:ribonuclease P protein component